MRISGVGARVGRPADRFVVHLALGGCLRAPPVAYGLTEDSGGHIAYVLNAARFQSSEPGIGRVVVVTRGFDAPRLGAVHLAPHEALAERAEIVRLFTARRAYLAKEALEAEVPALVRSFLRWIEAQPRLPDVIHAHFADAAMLALAARRRLGIPFAYTPHSLALDKQRSLGEGASFTRLARERRAIAEADALIVSSRDEAERQVPAYDPLAITRTHRLAPGVPTEAIGGSLEAARALVAPFLAHPDRPMVLAIARPVPKKNLDGLIEAFATEPRLAKANLVVLAGQRLGAEGEAAFQRLEALGRALGLEGRFALPPRHRSDMVGGLYRLAAATRGVFANPAHFEPFGLTLLEAAAVGLPVVATRAGGPATIVADLGHGRLVDPADRHEIGTALADLIDDKTLWHRHAASGKAGIGRYSWAAYARQSLALYRRLGRPPAAARVPAPLLITDLDGTLTGCASSAEAFAAMIEHSRPHWIVATGRTLVEARAVAARWQLPEPAAWLCSVGTELYLWEGDRLVADTSLPALLDRQWDRAAALDVVGRLGLRLQAEQEQRPHKISLFGLAADAARLARGLKAAGVCGEVVHSHGDLVDLLPPGAGKAFGAAHYARRFGLGLQHCIAAGDSGNDRDLLEAAGRSIVVGNASGELDRLMSRSTLYRARAAHAAGVLEALAALEPPLAQPIAA